MKHAKEPLKTRKRALWKLQKNPMKALCKMQKSPTNTPAPRHFRGSKSWLRRALPKTHKNPMKDAKEPLKTRKRAPRTNLLLAPFQDRKVGRQEHYRRRKRALQNWQKKPTKHAKERYERRNRALQDTRKHPTNTPAPRCLRQSNSQPKRALLKTEKSPTKDAKEPYKRWKRALQKTQKNLMNEAKELWKKTSRKNAKEPHKHTCASPLWGIEMSTQKSPTKGAKEPYARRKRAS